MQQIIEILKGLDFAAKQAIYTRAVELEAATGDHWYTDFIDQFLDHFDDSGVDELDAELLEAEPINVAFPHLFKGA